MPLPPVKAAPPSLSRTWWLPSLSLTEAPRLARTQEAAAWATTARLLELLRRLRRRGCWRGCVGYGRAARVANAWAAAAAVRGTARRGDPCRIWRCGGPVAAGSMRWWRLGTAVVIGKIISSYLSNL
nr:unnamed protein product [Digitaria exilis]